ncbi:ADP-glyceromanno-heptose 6-epimerase [Rhodospirillum rubrum]|uniref:ADP-glyceromanno-heptose 6-epimerase n=1 Tax=Rhodospirillum rubrum TaxID=1085 RepID=UPI0019062720|nr:ADP-glyceromanno-heptose 6-epimerase [Rhodospirillum rubrum]MBK1666074.1 ADP-glyceromanno-heptose 6-epimerase [Rhodospirillum rubrum]MBK1678200.1 ADP-glyceromanno-heptose 6-epimerase [Rhodospirillum rubrum]
MIIVTGGAGFIGSNILAGLEERGHGDLVLVDRLRDGVKWRNVAKRDLADIVAPEALSAFLDGHRGEVSAILHMGAISATTERDADRIIENNFRLSRDLWLWCAANGARFVYASSAATYGDGALGFDDDFSPAALARLRPLNAYGWSKHLFDRKVRHWVDSGSVPPQWAGLKFFNVYGPNETHKGPQSSVVSQIHPVARRGESFALFKSHDPRYADGGQLRDFVWIGDVVDIILWLLETPKVSGLFNVGTGRARSFADLAAAVYRALGAEPALTYRDMPEALRDKYQYFTQAEMGRLRAAGYPGQATPLEEGVRRYVQDYLEQPDPFR